MTKLQAVIFDFDFTLVDASQAFLICHRTAAADCGLASPADETVLRSIGTGFPAAFDFIYGDQPAAVRERYIGLYQAKADAVMAGMTRALPDAKPALARLRQQGLAMAVVSNKLH